MFWICCIPDEHNLVLYWSVLCQQLNNAGFEISLVRSSEKSKNDSRTSGIPAGLHISDFHISCIGFIYCRQVNATFRYLIFTIHLPNGQVHSIWYFEACNVFHKIMYVECCNSYSRYEALDFHILATTQTQDPPLSSCFGLIKWFYICRCETIFSPPRYFHPGVKISLRYFHPLYDIFTPSL